MSEVLVTKRSERNKLMDNLKKSPIYHALVVELIEMELSDLRTAYEDTSPASEFLRGQLVAMKKLHKDLTTK